MKTKREAPSGFYTAQEAIHYLGIKTNDFYKVVNHGAIRKAVGPNRSEGVYPVYEVEAYARQLRAFREQYHYDGYEYGLALAQDVYEIHDLVASVSGGEAHAVPAEVLRAWIRINPQALHILRKDSRIVGYIAAFPLQQETLFDRLSGRYLNRTLPINDIGQFLPRKSGPLYVAEMAVEHDPSHLKNCEPDPFSPDPQARLLGLRLIRGTMRFILELYRQRTIITDLYAVGTSPFGIAMCHDLGMEPMDLETGVRSDRIPFHLSLQDTVESVLVRHIQSVLTYA